MANFTDTILKTLRSLFPTGRATRVGNGTWNESFYLAISKFFNRIVVDSFSILDSILPDNDNFTVEDAALWERRLGVFGNENSSLEERKTAILRKMNFPGVAKARQHFLYLQGELQKAGFIVFIHENVIPVAPSTVVGNEFRAVHATVVQHGQIQHGTSNLNLVVNSIDQAVDDTFVVPANFRGTFFIGGEILGDLVSIAKDREEEFRQLILSIKPVQTIGILLINFI